MLVRLGKVNLSKVIVAEKAGFCSGVKRAVEELLNAAAQWGSGCTLGPVVHNEEVVAHLAEKGIRVVDHPQDAEGSFIAVRTHGVSPAVKSELEGVEQIKLIDLTCPRVLRSQNLVEELAGRGLQVVIAGDHEHPEIEGLLGWAGNRGVVVSSADRLKEELIVSPAALLAQTTMKPALFEEIKEAFLKLVPEGEIFDTLCPETTLKREEIKELASRVDLLVVVGSETSANTKALLEYCRQLKPACRVLNAGELKEKITKIRGAVGVTAGASTPPWTIKEVVESMENEKLEVGSEEQEAGSEEQFDFDGELKVAQVGEQVTGVVARVTEDEVYLDIGAKSEAILPAAEVHLDDGKSLADLFAAEDKVEVTVIDIDDQDGKVVVSHKRLDREKRLSELEQALEKGDNLEGKVKQVVGAGMVVDLGSGLEGFMPGSLVDTRYIPDFSEFADQTVQFRVIEFDREKSKLIVSRKAILEEEEAHKKEGILSSLVQGSTIKGTVKRLTNFGAFVDVGGIDGLVHISEISWDRVEHPKEVLKVGEEIDVKVLEVQPEKERISLSLRKTQPDPWTKAASELESGQLVKGKVTRLVNFGAFVELSPGLEGLAHISQLADYHVQHPSEVIQEGEEVEVKILEIKPKAKRISLSLKEARGVMLSPEKAIATQQENGNVTLGDVFGDLFDQEGETKGEEPAPEEDTVKDEADNKEEGAN